MQVKEWENKVIFLYTVMTGVAKGSYGIHVASLAGIPNSVLLRAKKILQEFETSGTLNNFSKEEKEVSTSKFIKTNNKTEIINNLINDMSVINLDALSPKEALDKLYTYVKKIKELE
jgi:DNA mismatch repair protein MutS